MNSSSAKRRPKSPRGAVSMPLATFRHMTGAKNPVKRESVNPGVRLDHLETFELHRGCAGALTSCGVAIASGWPEDEQSWFVARIGELYTELARREGSVQVGTDEAQETDLQALADRLREFADTMEGLARKDKAAQPPMR